jgi:hypothetical protein
MWRPIHMYIFISIFCTAKGRDKFWERCGTVSCPCWMMQTVVTFMGAHSLEVESVVGKGQWNHNWWFLRVILHLYCNQIISSTDNIKYRVFKYIFQPPLYQMSVKCLWHAWVLGQNCI